jgi:protease YdgD
MRRLLRRVAGAALVLAAFGAASAQEVPTGARRLVTDAEAASFRGVGRLNIAGRRFCTAALIAPDRAVTAAHCLYHPRSLKPVPLSELRFVAGYRRDAYAALRRVRRVAVAPGFVPGDRPGFGELQRDVALVELDAPIAADAAPAFAVAGVPLGDAPIVMVSYARDRAHAASIQENCRVRARAGSAVALDCGVEFGASGGPVLVHEKGGLGIFAVISAIGQLAGGGSVTLAVPVAPEIETLEGLLSEALADPQE